jgi:hypothetical protein
MSITISGIQVSLQVPAGNPAPTRTITLSGQYSGDANYSSTPIPAASFDAVTASSTTTSMPPLTSKRFSMARSPLTCPGVSPRSWSW